MALIKCPECGSEISDKSDKCIKCGCPLNNKVQSNNGRQKKSILIAILIFVFIVFIGIYFIKINKSRPDVGLFNNISWGSTYEDIKEIVENENVGNVISDDEKQVLIVEVMNYDNNENVSANILYKFDEGTIYSVFTMIQNGDSDYSDDELFEYYERKLSNLYGEGEDEIAGTKWITSKSIIKLLYYSDGVIILDYTDIDHEED